MIESRIDREKSEYQKGLRRESNPGHPHPKRVFYHLTTKPSNEKEKDQIQMIKKDRIEQYTTQERLQTINHKIEKKYTKCTNPINSKKR